jgi:long-chain acyl-CoA synthetase
MTLLAAVSRNYTPGQVLLKDSGHEFTAQQLLARCDELEQQLDAQEIQSLALHADNCVDWVVADLVCQRSCSVDALLTDADGGQDYSGIADYEDLGKAGLGELRLLRLAANEKAAAVPEGTGKITFTSGSTGQPKGVCLSHAQLQRQAQALRDCVAIEKPRHLCVLPLSTLLENVAGVYAPLLAGGELVIPGQAELGFKGSSLVDPQKFLHRISSVQPDSLILVPQLLLLLVVAVKNGWQPPPSLQFIAVGGSKVAADLLRAAAQCGLPVYEGYGLSECCSVVSLNTAAANEPGSCGKPLPQLQVSFLEGEVCVSGNSMLGYLGEPDSWGQQLIHTGDLGYLDSAGYLRVEGRKKDVLISSFGRNISPEWVESELLANPLLAEAVIVGDARPYCVALLTLREAATSSEVLPSWMAQVNEKLPDYARIKHWQVLPSPMGLQPGLFTENGRPKRERISAAYAAEIESLYPIEAVA